MKISTEERDGVTVVSVKGTADVYAAPYFRERLMDLNAAGCTALVVDIGEVDFLDSTGLGVILGAYKRIRARGGQLGVVCPEGCPSRSIFRLTGLVKVLDLRDTADEAVKALASEVTQ